MIEAEAAALKRFLKAQQEHLDAWLDWRECSGCSDASPAFERWAFGVMLDSAAEAYAEAIDDDEDQEEPLKQLPAPVALPGNLFSIEDGEK